MIQNNNNMMNNNLGNSATVVDPSMSVPMGYTYTCLDCSSKIIINLSENEAKCVGCGKELAVKVEAPYVKIYDKKENKHIAVISQSAGQTPKPRPVKIPDNVSEEDWRCFCCGAKNEKAVFCVVCGAKFEKQNEFKQLRVDATLDYVFKCPKCEEEITEKFLPYESETRNVKCSKCNEEYELILDILDPNNLKVKSSGKEIMSLNVYRCLFGIPQMSFFNMSDLNGKVIPNPDSLNYDTKYKDNPEAQKEAWKCECGQEDNHGKFCINCGAIRK